MLFPFADNSELRKTILNLPTSAVATGPDLVVNSIPDRQLQGVVRKLEFPGQPNRASKNGSSDSSKWKGIVQ